MADKSEQVVTSHHRSSPKIGNSAVRSNSAAYHRKTTKVDSAVEVLRKNLHKQQQQQQQKSNKSSLTTMCDEEDEEFLDEEDEELDGQPDDDNLSSGLPGDNFKSLLNALSSGSYNGSPPLDEATLNAMYKVMQNASTAGGQSATTNTVTNSALLNSNLDTFSSMAASPCNSQTSNRHPSPVSNISNSANSLSLNRADSATANSMNNSHSFAQLSSPVSSNCTTPMSVISTTTSNAAIPGRNKVFECKTCNRKFGYKHVLQNHERIHTGEKPFSCHICEKKFTRDHHLKTHYRLHTGEKPFECEHCTKRFVQIANLRRHLRTHTGERPYACEIPNCDSRFSDSNQLKAHMLIHLNQKPYKCDKCQGFYRRRHHLIHHKCPMDESNLGKPRRGRRPRAYESQSTLLPMDVHLSGNSLNNSLNNSSSNNSSTNNLNNLSTNSMNNSLINSNSLQSINNSSTGNNLLDALSIQTAGHLANNSVSSKIQSQAAVVAANSLLNSLTGNHSDLLGGQLGSNLSNNLLNSLFGQALSAADNNSANDSLEEMVRSNKLNQLSNLMKNGASQNAQSQQIEQLTRNLNGLNQNKSSPAAANNMASLLNSNNLVNTLQQQQQQLMTALTLTNLNNNLNALGSLSNLNSLTSLNNLNSLQNYLQNAMQMAPLDFSSTNSTKKNSTSNHRNKSSSNALDLSQVKQEQALNDDLDEKDDEESNLLLMKEQLKNLNKFGQLGHPLLLNHQLQMLNNLNRPNSQEDSMSVDEDCFESEDKIGVNNNSKRNKNLNKASPKSINNNSLSSLNKNHDALMDCDLAGRELNGQRGKAKSPESAKNSIKEDQLSSLSKEELEMLLRKQFNNNNPLPSDTQFDQNADELSNALRNLIPSHLLSDNKQKIESTSIFEKLLQQKQPFNNSLHLSGLGQQIAPNEHDLLTSINNLSNNSNNSGGNSPKNISTRNQLRRHMDHNANETVSTIVANAAK